MSRDKLEQTRQFYLDGLLTEKEYKQRIDRILVKRSIRDTLIAFPFWLILFLYMI